MNLVDCIWNVMAHAQKPVFVFRRNGRVHLNRRGRQFSRLLAAEVCASAVLMLDTPCSEVMWRVLVTHSIRQFPLHFPSRASPRVITFQLDSNTSFSTVHISHLHSEICGVYAHGLKTAINGGWRCKEVYYQIYRFSAAFTGHKFISSNLNWRVHCRTGSFFF